ncbi:hypothetical protein PMAYCL1PPCAC_25777, partial [Pristionchus mayeri]
FSLELQSEMLMSTFENDVRFNSTDEILPYIAHNLPNCHKALIKELEFAQSKIAQLDENGKSLAYEIRDFIMNDIVAMTKLGFSRNFVLRTVRRNVIGIVREVNELTGHEISMLIRDLPQTSKDAFDKV